MTKLWGVALLICLLTSCSVEPPYRRPSVVSPPTWRWPTNHASTCCNVAWWKQFGDPVLDCLIHEAIRNNQEIRVAIHRVRQASAKWCVDSSYLYPTINGELDLARQEISENLHMLPAGAPRTSNYIKPYFSVSYEIDLWQRVASASRASMADLLASVSTRRTVVLTTVAAVASTYIQMREYDAMLRISKETLASRLASVDLAKARYEGGLTSLLDLKQAEAEMLVAASSVEQMTLQVALQENALNVLLGKNPGPVPRGLTIEELQQQLCVPMGLPSDLLERRPDIMEAEEKIIAAHYRVAEAKALFFPQINFSAIYGYGSIFLSNLLTNASKTWYYGLSAIEPLFNAERIACQVKEAQEVRWEALYNYHQTILQAFKEVNNALISEYQTKLLIKTLKERVDDLQDYYDLAYIRYFNGEDSYLTVLDAERMLFRAELDLAENQGNHALSFVDLYKSLGGGWVINSDCQAMQHQKEIDAHTCESVLPFQY